jgi:hypothetical protein
VEGDTSRWTECDGRRDHKQIELVERPLRLLLLLRFFAFGDEFADRTGMFAVEGADQRFLKGRRLGVAREHGHPGNGLQHGPMPAQHKNERQHRQPFQQPGGHAEQARQGTACVNRKPSGAWAQGATQFSDVIRGARQDGSNRQPTQLSPKIKLALARPLWFRCQYLASGTHTLASPFQPCIGPGRFAELPPAGVVRDGGQSGARPIPSCRPWASKSPVRAVSHGPQPNHCRRYPRFTDASYRPFC